MNDEMNVKKKVLEEIMQLMEEQMKGRLESKRPKAMEVSVEAVSLPKKDDEEDMSQESKNGDMFSERVAEKDSSDDDDLERLKEMYERLN